MANLPKMQAAQKEQGHRKTPKRRAASRANLAIRRAVKYEMGARVVEGLKHALPPPDPKDQAAQGEVAERAGRTIGRRWETMGRAVRKQGRRVMELLRKAAARVVPAGGRCWR